MPKIVSGYGKFPLEDIFECDKFKFSFLKNENVFYYTREVFNSSKIRKILSFKDFENVLIQPSEPLVDELQKTHLYLEFEEPLSLLPETKLNGFATIPVSISIFAGVSNKNFFIDLFNISNTKFALYGNPHFGYVCRYWKTKFSTQPIEPKLFETAILDLELENLSTNTITLTKLVFDFAYIRIYYNNTLAKAKAKARIQSETFCETEFLDILERDRSVLSIDLIPTKAFSSSKFVMVNGI